MNTQALTDAKAQCQIAAEQFMGMEALGHAVPAEQIQFNRAVLLALKGLYEAIESI